MYRKSRSDWLKLSKQHFNSKRSGRKRFTMHKNDHSVVLYPESPVLAKSQSNIPKYVSRSPEPTKISMIHKLQPINVEFYKQKLKKKQMEINLLKSLFNDTTKKLLEHERKISSNIKKTSSDIVYQTPTKKSFQPQFKTNNFLDFSSHPAFSQPKYTKNKPKLVITNPITGISPLFESNSFSF